MLQSWRISAHQWNSTRCIKSHWNANGRSIVIFLICLIIQIKWCCVVAHKFIAGNQQWPKVQMEYSIPSAIYCVFISIHYVVCHFRTQIHSTDLKRMNPKIQPWMDDLLCSIQCVLKTRNAYVRYIFSMHSLHLIVSFPPWTRQIEFNRSHSIHSVDYFFFFLFMPTSSGNY